MKLIPPQKSILRGKIYTTGLEGIMEGIVTMYHGRRYRSRLEARWAVMFHLLGWRYEYEPYDLSWWIPDFVLFGAEEIIVEVKPYTLLEEFDTGKILAALKSTEKWGKEILLLGCSILVPNTLQLGIGDDPVILGYLGEFQQEDEYCFGNAVLNCYEGWGFYHHECGWKDRMTGLYEGDHYHRTPDYEEVLKLWNQAGNIVQFRGER